MEQLLKGTVSVNLCEPLHAKTAMLDLQRYPWTLIWRKNMEEPVVFLTQKVFISVNFSFASYKEKSPFQRNQK